MLIAKSVFIAFQFNEYVDSSDQYIEITKSALELQEGSDYLTDQARAFILSSDMRYVERYFHELNEIQRREKAIEKIKHHFTDSPAMEHLEKALNESKALEAQELYAMKLVLVSLHLDQDQLKTIPSELTDIHLLIEDAVLDDKTKIAKAWIILFSEGYLQRKTEISTLKNQAMDMMFQFSDELHDNNLSKLTADFGRMLVNIIGIFLLNLLFFIFIIFYVIKPLLKNIKNIGDGRKLSETKTKEFNILTTTYNQMYDKNESNEILLRHKAEHDELTGLINRAAFNKIKEALSGTKENIALILIDVDFFKIINDTHGHPVGDKVLKRVSMVLLENFRTTDYVARVGGDEFIVIMTRCDSDAAKTANLVSSKMEAIKEKLAIAQDGLPATTLSCGIALSTSGYSDTLYEHADMALYEVKRAGRNDFTFYKDNATFEV